MQKNQKAILQKLGIEQLNPMQEEAQLAIHSTAETIILSPTGTGKTLAFLLPLVAMLDADLLEIQAIIVVPSRELAIQIEQVTREMGAGYRTLTVYGGRSFNKDKIALQTPPSILIGTPGRVAAHLRRATIDTEHTKALVLDEFDKSLEIGFEEEMKEIIAAIRPVEKKILTSATQGVRIPDFVKLQMPITVNYLDEKIDRLTIKIVESPTKDKLPTLFQIVKRLNPQPGIIFCNFKDTIQRVSNYLDEHDIQHGCFYGNMEQADRETSLVKFRNGTHQLIVATDLASRGIDIPEIKYIVHYHLPHRKEEFTHRNGRTARMHSDGTAYVIKWTEERMPDFIDVDLERLTADKLVDSQENKAIPWTTVRLSGGRRDKISKGDIAGFCFKQGGLEKGDVGIIELRNDHAFVAIRADKVGSLIKKINNQRLKKAKVRVGVV